MGWTPSYIRRYICMIKLWNKLIDLDDQRVIKKVFLWDYRNPGISWCSDMKMLFRDIDYMLYYQNFVKCNIVNMKRLLLNAFMEKWRLDCTKVNKLKTYIKYKEEFNVEPYLIISMNRKCRSYVAQFRCGILPLKIETGRFSTQYVPEQNRICSFCESNSIENEYHFVFDCSLYNELRNDFIHNVYSINPDIRFYSRDNKIKYFMSRQYIKLFSNFVRDAFELRKTVLYN